jgi:hypothetical protein
LLPAVDVVPVHAFSLWLICLAALVDYSPLRPWAKDPCSTNSIVKSPLIAIECSNDKANQACKQTNRLGKGAGQGMKIGQSVTLSSQNAGFASHFSGGRTPSPHAAGQTDGDQTHHRSR